MRNALHNYEPLAMWVTAAILLALLTSPALPTCNQEKPTMSCWNRGTFFGPLFCALSCSDGTMPGTGEHLRDGSAVSGDRHDALVPDSASGDAGGDVPDAAVCRPAGEERCNGRDDDCDGLIDEGQDAVDSDDDQVPDCLDDDDDNDGSPDALDCAPQDPIRGPAAAELCNGVDDNCGGAVDEELSRGCYDGPPGTSGMGQCRDGQQACVAGAFAACVGQVLPSTETCDGLDNDCDRRIDEGFQDQSGAPDCLDRDADGDRIADVDDNCAALENAEQLDFDADGQGDACDEDDDNDAFADGGDCAPLDPALHPGTDERCDGVDGDCDGSVDEGVFEPCYGGADGTAGIGRCAAGLAACEAGSFGACVGAVEPEAERCDLVDEDCDGLVDEGTDRAFVDADGDGFGVVGQDHVCGLVPGYAAASGDCDDAQLEVNPLALDLPDLTFTDLDCDGVDGAAVRMVFVRPDADALGDGTRDRPFQSVAQANALAGRDPNIVGIALARGTLHETVALRDGVSIYGGYDAAQLWARDVTFESIIEAAPAVNGQRRAVSAIDIRRPTALQLLTLQVPDALVQGQTNIGLLATRAPGLALLEVRAFVGRGGEGASGLAGLDGQDGGDGTSGGDCGGAFGQGGVSVCLAEGGNGGSGGNQGEDGQSGLRPGCGGAGGRRGGAGAGSDGSAGCTPGDRLAANDGAIAQAPGVDAFDVWHSGDGRGGGDGQAGLPGGGGGGGGGAAVIGGTAGAGGGGGAGGCGGRAGSGGSGGGGAFGLMALGSEGLTAIRCTFQIGDGGRGGDGGTAGQGGNGGSAGGRGRGREAFFCGGLAGPGWGGDGGRGARGEAGGHGSAGNGGPSVAVYCLDTPLEPDGHSLRVGNGGAAGLGSGAAGTAGLSALVVGCDLM